jgi:hypothetical protein
MTHARRLTLVGKERMSTKSFQVASVAHPIELLWPPSHYDQGEATRGIKCFVDNPKLVESLEEVDEGLIKRDEHGRCILRLKVWQSASVVLQGSDQFLSVDDLKRGDQITVFAKAHHWSFEGKQGASLTVSHILIVERDSRQCPDTPVQWL